MRKLTASMVVVLLIASGCSEEVLKEVGNVVDSINDLQNDQSQDKTTDSDPAASALIAEAVAASTGRSVRGTATVESSAGGASESSVVSQFEYAVNGAASMNVPMGDTDAPGDSDTGTSTGTEFRYVGGTMYMRVPKAAADLKGLNTKGVKGDWVWMTVGAEMLDDMSGVLPLMALCNVHQTGQTADANDQPCDSLKSMIDMIKVATGAAVIGDGDANGVPVTRVSLTVPLFPMGGLDNTNSSDTADMDNKAVDVVDTDPDSPDTTVPSADGSEPAGDGAEANGGAEEGDIGEVVSGFFNILGRILGGGIAAEIWIDDDKLIRRFSLDAASILTGEFSDSDTSGTPVAKLTFDFRDFNADINISTPPAELILGDLSLLGS